MTSQAQEVSSAIRVARVLCIFFVMFVHVWPGTAQFNPARGLTGWDLTYHFFSDVLGRSSVPLLSIVSGWLVAKSYRGWRELLRSRFVSLIIPLVAWNLILLAALLGYDQIGDARWDRPADALGWLNAIFALTEAPATLALAFLRDLFACMLLAPALLKLAAFRKTWITAGIISVILAWVLFIGETWLILRPMILAFFVLGLLLKVYEREVGRSLISAPWIAGALAVIAASFVISSPGVRVTLPAGPITEAQQLIVRLAVAYTFWCASLSLVGTQAGGKLAQIEPHIFFVFCSHTLVLKALVPLTEPIVGGYYSPVYPAYFFIQPALALAVGATSCWVLALVAPWLLWPLNAGKTPATLTKRRFESPHAGMNKAALLNKPPKGGWYVVSESRHWVRFVSHSFSLPMPRRVAEFLFRNYVAD